MNKSFMFIFCFLIASYSHSTEVLSCKALLKGGSKIAATQVLDRIIGDLPTAGNGLVAQLIKDAGVYPQLFYRNGVLTHRQANFSAIRVGSSELSLPKSAMVGTSRILSDFQMPSKELQVELQGVRVIADHKQMVIHGSPLAKSPEESRPVVLASLSSPVQQLVGSVLIGNRMVYTLGQKLGNGTYYLSSLRLPKLLPQTEPVQYIEYQLDRSHAAKGINVILPYDRFILIGGTELGVLDTGTGQYVTLRMPENYGRTQVVGLRDLFDGTILVITTGTHSSKKSPRVSEGYVEHTLDLTKIADGSN